MSTNFSIPSSRFEPLLTPVQPVLGPPPNPNRLGQRQLGAEFQRNLSEGAVKERIAHHTNEQDQSWPKYEASTGRMGSEQSARAIYPASPTTSVIPPFLAQRIAQEQTSDASARQTSAHVGAAAYRTAEERAQPHTVFGPISPVSLSA